MEFKTKSGAEVKVDITPEKASEAAETIVKWCEQHECFHGETLMQSDDPQVDAPWLLSSIIDDILKFDVKWDDE